MKLNTKQKNHEPKSDFALPDQRKFPIPDKAHAANAKARATQGVEKGTLSKSDATRVKRKADQVLASKSSSN